MTVTISQAAFRAIVDHSQSQFPLEACGLLAGTNTTGQKTVTQAIALPNLAQSRYRFEIAPQDQLKAVLAMRKLGLTPLGNYHSHPETPARPSVEDLALFVDPSASYIIVSLAERLPVVKCFNVGQGENPFSEDELVVNKEI
ncbi:MAG: M67 family metallopeptidase [Deltaproteobacteria bacterium]|jgi:proteasome lid subunit RPN8/RPN11|nr:M67 family metallopeptidase [Deltaproteobacteria bacterium]